MIAENRNLLKHCTVCNSQDLEEVLSIPNVPAHCNLLWDSREEAVNCPKGTITLTFCHHCGHLFNSSFDPSLMEYTQSYENSLHFSGKFQEFAQNLAKQLTDRFKLSNKNIVEIGCGKGDFLTMICDLGGNTGYGFDKSYVPPENGEDPAKNVHFIQDFYSKKYADYEADMIICRHVLEHIHFPTAFLKEIKDISKKNTQLSLYFEVPNTLYSLRDLGIWDLIYEHCSYFTAVSLAHLFKELDFSIVDVNEKYGGQFLGIESTVRHGHQASYQPPMYLEELKGIVLNFQKIYQSKVSEWKSRLEDLKAKGKKAVVWGGGSKGVTFLNIMESKDLIGEVVDINPRKQGRYVAGTGQEYISPAALRKVQPDIVILMNPLYLDEVGDQLKALDIDAEILVA